MNKNTIRSRFKYYRSELAKLHSEIYNLETQIADQSYYNDMAESRRQRRDRAVEAERQERARQEEADRWYREDQVKKATKDLERARSYGNDYEVDNAIRKLKNIYW